MSSVTFEGHYDREADIAWLRFVGYDPATAMGEQTSFGLRELSPAGEVVGLELWAASAHLPEELLAVLPAPPVGTPV